MKTQNFMFDGLDPEKEHAADMAAAEADARIAAIEKNLGAAAAKWADRNAAGWVLDRLADPCTCLSVGLRVLPAEIAGQLLAPKGPRCPGCSGSGVLTDDPQVLRCQSCGGIFTDPNFPIIGEAAIQFVAYHLPMLANAGPDGSFYFDLDILRPSDGGRTRIHGWADKATKRVVQFG